MKATVVTPFTDAETGVVYKKIGQEYPTENVSEKRLDLLSKPHPKTGKVYIFVEKVEQQNEEVAKQDVTPEPAEEKTAPKRTRKAPAKKDGE